MVKGMSFNKGIMFLGKRNLVCTYEKKGVLKTWIKPIKGSTLLEASRVVFFTMPLWFHLFLCIWLLLIALPKLAYGFGWEGWYGLPVFSIIYFFFGTHFWFPTEMKKYHGAEHKVFSYKGIISTGNKKEIQDAEITNRFCSTNGIFLYFLLVVFIWLVLMLISSLSWITSLEVATYSSVLLWPISTYWLNRTKTTILHQLILAGSYWLQKHITTLEPDHRHLQVAIRSYRRLALKEFPKKLQISKRKEQKHMAIVDVTVIPIGTETTSVSEVVVEIHRVLEESKRDIRYELTPMSTIIEGELEELLQVIKEIHEVPFKLGIKRVATNIRIDDRRDRQSSIASKLASVQSQLEKKG